MTQRPSNEDNCSSTSRVLSIYTPATQAGTPATDLPHYLCVRTGLRLSKFKNCDKGLVFLFVRVLQTQSLDFNHGCTCGKEELVLRQLFSFLPPTSACSFLMMRSFIYKAGHWGQRMTSDLMTRKAGGSLRGSRVTRL